MDAGRRGAPEALRRAHPAAPVGDARAADTFAEVNDQHTGQQGFVVTLIGPLEGWLAANPGDIDGQELRQRLLAHYRR